MTMVVTIVGVKAADFTSNDMAPSACIVEPSYRRPTFA